jgi:DNA-binding NtrC family response regulator
MIESRLFADRFMRFGRRRATDLATGQTVFLRMGDAGVRREQEVWTDRCARSMGSGRSRVLIDFGFVGRDSRFEVYRPGARTQSHCQADASTITPPIGHVVEWIEGAASASRFLNLPVARLNMREWVETLAREVRLRGFVPVSVSMMRRHPHLTRSLGGRSVVMFDTAAETNDPAGTLCLSILQLLAAPPRAVFAISAGRPAGSLAVVQAAERRPMYGGPARAPVLPLAPLVKDARAVTWLDEGCRLMRRGRHAAAERSFRAALAAFERRGDAFRSADVAMTLGRLLLARGRTADAEDQFSGAREKFQGVGAASAAASASVFAGLAQTDAGQFERADVTLRAAFTATNALAHGDEAQSIRLAGVALARNAYWQGRFAEGVQLLQTVDHGDCPRYWSLLAKLHLAAAHSESACHCANRARDALGARPEADLESVVRTAQARVQARLGDMEALCLHVRAGIEAARAARLPLQILRLRLTLIEGLLDAGFQSRARAAGRAVAALSRATLPRPLRDRVQRVSGRLADASPLERRVRDDRPTFSHESGSAFHVDHTDRVAELLSACQAVDDERAALHAVANLVRKQLGAVAVGIFGVAPGVPTQYAGAGSISTTLARRCMELGQPMAPAQGEDGIEGAAPVVHLGRIIGAVACRWTLEGPRGSHDVLAFPRIAAAACAPVLQILLERQSLPAPEASTDGSALIGVSASIQDVRRSIARAANAPFTVLIEGESGAGKELVANAIHRAGCRRDKALRALNCAALTEELVDSELFGHAKGAFTGALTERLGLFESAEGGTVFLDEVGELSTRAQAKLLRTLQEGEIRRIGENFTRPIDARVIAATNRSLAGEAQAGRFRQDLLYRLDVIRITVPPLRERVEDVPLLACRFWRDATERIGSKAVLGQAALAALARYDWPGNVRELQNVLASLAVSVPGRGVVPASAMPAAIARAGKVDARETLDAARRQFEERFVRAALARSAGHRGHTASALGVSRQGLAKLMQRLQLP